MLRYTNFTGPSLFLAKKVTGSSEGSISIGSCLSSFGIISSRIGLEVPIVVVGRLRDNAKLLVEGRAEGAKLLVGERDLFVLFVPTVVIGLLLLLSGI
jgi:hypothetical protein